jgi:hypothetical protein
MKRGKEKGRKEAWTTIEEDYILTWGPELKPV